MTTELLRARYDGWAVIAGASEGLGRAFALALGRAGFDLLLIARRQGPLEALAAEIRRECGVATEIAALDLALPDAVDRFAAFVGERPIAVFIYCAGADAAGATFLHGRMDAWRPLISCNVVNLTEITYHVAARMAEARRGAIILVSSEGALGGTARAAVYSATKAYQLNLGEALWAELRPVGVDVLTLVIGATDTPALRRVLARHGLSVDPSMLADPAATVDQVLAHLTQGPTLILPERPGEMDDIRTASGRRLQVERTSSYLEAFYGEEPLASNAPAAASHGRNSA